MSILISNDYLANLQAQCRSSESRIRQLEEALEKIQLYASASGKTVNGDCISAECRAVLTRVAFTE